ncbi:PD-(D/E)XK nuclease family protein [Streptomyces sp. 5.8]|uniref:PD-(D/E)XK nuclease family protein n=1 Tax=Streptomyces sp. 5.8 TaxID=3406571 RepID=UPI003BB4E24A
MTAAAETREAETQALAERVNRAITSAFLIEADADYHETGCLSISGIGSCARAAAFCLSGATPAEPAGEPDEQRTAALGRYIHAGLIPRLAQALGVELTAVEQSVTLTVGDVVLDGRSDLVLYAGGGLVIDVKTVARLGDKELTVPRRHRLQLGGYALALRQAGQGIERAGVLWVCRTTGRTSLVLWDVTEAVLREVEQRIEQIQRWASMGPLWAPREAPGPGLSRICDRCPWLTRCWPGAQPGVSGAQAVLLNEGTGIAEAAAGLAVARAAKKSAAEDEEFWLAVLGGTATGTYEDDIYRAEIARKPGASRPDQRRMRELLEEAEIPVPYARNRDSVEVVVTRTR